eukprot:CAMPEP_0170553380 /NCGR_PEP_ID=MMETSP0211-20121228/11199_1 /TAXON_ID=311385 /ORGANISM="Pseudokeronopsis sp., Strain OXSARD2" /LENGTH=144 /DNA_ID=CAMNT_0010861667 /DNA_START=459 /DNA_END=893 /DNA_ORIENTATION=+
MVDDTIHVDVFEALQQILDVRLQLFIVINRCMFILDFFREVGCFVTILHEHDIRVLSLGVVVELDDIVMLHLGMDYALLLGVSVGFLVHELTLLDDLLDGAILVFLVSDLVHEGGAEDLLVDEGLLLVLLYDSYFLGNILDLLD